MPDRAKMWSEDELGAIVQIILLEDRIQQLKFDMKKRSAKQIQWKLQEFRDNINTYNEVQKTIHKENAV